jgi:hypothetical protein
MAKVLQMKTAILAATVVMAFAASLLGCASFGPVTPVAAPDVKAMIGLWKGVVYRSGFEPDSVALTIHDDGSYDVVSVGPGGTSSGRGRIVVSDRRLLVEGERGRGAGTLLRGPDGDLVLNIDMILNDNTTLTAKLWRNR